MAWAITSSKAKKVKWSQRQTVLPSPSSVEQPWESQSPVGEEKGRESLPLSSPSAPWKPVVSFLLILERSSKPTFSHIPEYTGEDHILKPERVSQKRREAGKKERREDGALPGVCMYPKRKLSAAYMGSTSVDAPWTTVHMGYTTYMAQEGLPVCVHACLPSGSWPGEGGKHVHRWVLQVPTHL